LRVTDVDDRVAEAEARRLLAAVGTRLAHTRAVVAQVDRLAAALEVSACPLLRSAAWLHDVGYAPVLARCGFHPLDGARYLAEEGWPAPVCSLVAWHTGAAVEARHRRCADELSEEFAPPDPALLASLTWADLTSSPTGEVWSARRRVDEILERYPPGSIVHAAVLESRDELLAAAAVVDRLTTGRQPT